MTWLSRWRLQATSLPAFFLPGPVFSIYETGDEEYGRWLSAWEVQCGKMNEKRAGVSNLDFHVLYVLNEEELL